MNPFQQLADWLAGAQRAVAFTGAGISTESGIPDFRSPGGIWTKSQPVYFQDFLSSAEARCEYWRQKAAATEFKAARPNTGHQVLAKWELSGPLAGIVTQNIDGLHQDAGSQCVIELHGTARWVACLDCHTRFPAQEMVEQFLAHQQPPSCPHCGGITKHATISFGQSLDADVLREAQQLCTQADLLFAMGSSLLVQPAASLPEMASQSGAKLVIINRDPTPADDVADLVIHASIGDTLAQIDRLYATCR